MGNINFKKRKDCENRIIRFILRRDFGIVKYFGDNREGGIWESDFIKLLMNFWVDFDLFRYRFDID